MEARRARILVILKHESDCITTAGIKKIIADQEKITDPLKIRYLDGSLSSLLNKMFVEGQVERHEGFGMKGGYGWSLPVLTKTGQTQVVHGKKKV